MKVYEQSIYNFEEQPTVYKFFLSSFTLPSVGGSGDMTKAVYDPTGVNDDAFSMGNMVETATSKILTDTERTKLTGIEVGAQVNSVDYANPISITGATALTSGGFHYVTGTSGNYSVTLPSAATNSGKFIEVQIAPAASASKLYTITGAVTAGGYALAMHANEWVRLRSNGTNWVVSDEKHLDMFAKLGSNSSSNQLIANATLAKVTSMNVNNGESMSGMVDTVNSRIDILRAGAYRVYPKIVYTGDASTSVAAFTEDIACQTRVNKNGSLAFNVVHYGKSGSTTQFIESPSSELVLAAGDYLELYAFRQTLGAALTTYVFRLGCRLEIEEMVRW